ncbi:MAG: serine hydrolase domain-containing protein [Bacteroidota bacterium]
MKKLLFFLPTLLLLAACHQVETLAPETYTCQALGTDLSDQHPNAGAYEALINGSDAQGLVGGAIFIQDENGYWQSAWGKANIEADISMETCHRFLIASISKVFTATVIHAMVDDGYWKLDDPISQYLHPDTVARIAHADQATLGHLLSHTSGIPDHYTVAFELDRINQIDNEWRHEDFLSYVFGQPATFELGTSYGYSNTNYVLLGILAERVSGESLASLYENYIFQPLGLESAYFDGYSAPIPTGTAQGYGQLYKEGLIASTPLYQDELKTGDGGIAIHAADLGKFYQGLANGQLLSTESYAAMTNWFELPEDWVEDVIYQNKNGYGLEYFDYPNGYAWGHTGSVDGFLSIAMYFPETQRTAIFLTNEASGRNNRLNVWNEVLDILFE